MEITSKGNTFDEEAGLVVQAPKNTESNILLTRNISWSHLKIISSEVKAGG